MKIIFCKHTALFLLRMFSRRAPAPAAGRELARTPSAAYVAKVACDNPLLAECPRPLHVLAPDGKRPRNTADVVFHTWSARVPAAQLREPVGGLCCLGPELTLLHLAADLHPAALLMVAHELCGRYRIRLEQPGFFEAEPLTTPRRIAALLHLAADLHPAALLMVAHELCGRYRIRLEQPGFFEAEPLTTPRRIAACGRANAGAPGAKPLRGAIPHMGGNAHSPMEAAVALLLGLPNRLGGLGLPRPELNRRVTPGRRGREATSASFYDCDLLWPEARLALEYDSDLCHADADRLNSDAARRTALLALGITVVTATHDQIYQPRQFRQLETTLRRQLGVRRQIRCRDFEQRQRELRRHVLGVGLGQDAIARFIRFGS